jgi:hypothetical protein
MDSETVPDPTHSPSIQCLAISLIWGSFAIARTSRFREAGAGATEVMGYHVTGCYLIPVIGFPA